MSDKYYNFQEISQGVNFVDVLNWLNIPFAKKKGECKGETEKFKFVINVEKNLFFSPSDQSIKGSVINFLSEHKEIGLRDAAKDLHKAFIESPKPVKKEIPNLDLLYTPEIEKFGISKETAEEYEVGLVKQRSIMNGRIAFKVYDENGKVEGYVGWRPKTNDWFFPKNFKRPLYNAHNIAGHNIIVVVNLFDCLFLLNRGIQASSCLIARSMTDRQEEALKKFSTILLLHPEPENIVNRMSKGSFVKAPEINKLLKDYTDEEIAALLG